MGYEIAGGLGVKLALPEREVWVLLGDGSYLLMNSEIATSITLGKKLNIIVLDNGGFGCIERLQRACGSASFNNLFPGGSGVDFAAHAVSLGGCMQGRKPGRARKRFAGAPPGAPRSLSSQPIRLSALASVAPGGTWPSPSFPAGLKLLRLVLPMTQSECDARPRINQRNLRNATRQCPHSVTNDRQPRVSILPTFDPDPEPPQWVKLRRTGTAAALPVSRQ
jgi:hypothetical protein